MSREKKTTSVHLSVVNVDWAKKRCLNLSEYVDAYLTREREKDESRQNSEELKDVSAD